MTSQIARKNTARMPQRRLLWKVIVIALLAVASHPAVAAAATPAVAIDATATSRPISKYIFGQFIEHLGHCIYGGIWSEMVADRKFFAPVGGKGSPWQAMGSAEPVTMDSAGSFVGDQTPKITAPGDGTVAGIGQAGLGLVAGKAYTGRIYLAGDPQAGPIDVSLIWDNRPDQRQTISIDRIGTDYAMTPLQFVARATTDRGRLEITTRSGGSFHVGTVSLMPADNIHGMRRDTLNLLKQLNAPIYRWPGGNFVSGYNWKDGIGDRDRRPPRKNPAWKGIEPNDFGIDEFMTFCREVRTEPYVVVNSGRGDATAAVAEVNYANAPTTAPMGQLRARNGHVEPYDVTWWGIGNEMYGKWQIGHMPLEKYVEKHNRFAAAMRAADNTIQLVAVGASGPWSEAMMQHCADAMDLVSEHFYCQEKSDLRAHVEQIPGQIRHKADVHRNYRRRFASLQGKDIRIALDEWNYWYGPHLYGELGTRYFLKDALGVAAGLNELSRQSDLIFMANYAQTVNVIGCIKTTKTAATFATTGLPLKLYRTHFGTIPVKVLAPKPLDVAAAWTPNRDALTIAVVNPTMKPRQVPLEVHGATFTGSGQKWQIAGSDPQAYNAPGQPPQVVIEAVPLAAPDGSSQLTVAPCSVTLYRLEVR
ncbi:MAG: alpha-L-arabinofuranosidase C-terminal domain-containing protein [Pirellulales bacterium]